MAVWLLALIPAGICAFVHYWHKWHGDAPSGTILARATARFSRRSRRGRDVGAALFALAAIAMVAVAVMRPQLASEVRTPTFERRDLVVLLDRSISMRARDVAPSRFARAVDEIQRFLREKPQGIDRVALIGFAGTPVVLSYPTDDVDSLAFYLEWAGDDDTPMFGTNIASALATAMEMSRRQPASARPVFVVISDGEDQSGRMTEAEAALVRAGVHVHCIGIGSDAAVPMPVPVGDGREEFLRDDDGTIVTTRFAGATLQRLAASTGGQYFRSTQGGELLRALSQIAAEERQPTGWQTTRADRDIYRVFLAAAAIATLGLVILL